MDVIERAARALCMSRGVQVCTADENGGCLHCNEGGERFFVGARAVIESLREPSEEMLSAGQVAGISSLLDTAESDEDVPRDTWRAMIDAILNNAD